MVTEIRMMMCRVCARNVTNFQINRFTCEEPTLSIDRSIARDDS